MTPFPPSDEAALDSVGAADSLAVPEAALPVVSVAEAPSVPEAEAEAEAPDCVIVAVVEPEVEVSGAVAVAMDLEPEAVPDEQTALSGISTSTVPQMPLANLMVAVLRRMLVYVIIDYWEYVCR